MTSGTPVRAFIDMLPRVNVDDDPVLLGDIAAISGQDTTLVDKLKILVVGRAPLPGKSRQIEAAYVALRLKQNSIPLDQVVLNEITPTTVVRNSTIVSQDQIKSVIRDALLGRIFFRDDGVWSGISGLQTISLSRRAISLTGYICGKIHPVQQNSGVCVRVCERQAIPQNLGDPSGGHSSGSGGAEAYHAQTSAYHCGRYSIGWP